MGEALDYEKKYQNCVHSKLIAKFTQNGLIEKFLIKIHNQAVWRQLFRQRSIDEGFPDSEYVIMRLNL